MCGHGSRHPDGVDGFLEMVEKFRHRNPGRAVEAGFLEFAEPTLSSAIEKLYAQGARDIIAVPAFLFTGIHLRGDLPGLMVQSMEKYAGLRIRMAPGIGVCEELVELGCQRIIEAKAKSAGFDHREALLFGIGVGSSVAEANGDIAKLNQLVCERAGLAYPLLGFASSIVKPRVADSAEILSYLPQKTVLALPLLIFNGAYLEASVATLGKTCRESGKTLVVCDPFQSDTLILGAMERRMDEVLTGGIDLVQGFDREMAGERDPGHC